MELNDIEAAYAAGIDVVPPYPSAPFQESMSRCRAYPFQVHPSGLASAVLEAFPDVSRVCYGCHHPKGLYFPANPRPKKATTSVYKLSRLTGSRPGYLNRPRFTQASRCVFGSLYRHQVNRTLAL